MHWDELEGPHAGLLADHVPERPSRALRISAGERNIRHRPWRGCAGSGTQVPACFCRPDAHFSARFRPDGV